MDKLPYALSLLTMISGIFIAIMFGANEGLFKKKIAADLARNPQIQAIQDPARRAAKIAGERSKNWRYYQRFHFHSTGIGAMSMALVILAGLLGAPRPLRLSAQLVTAVGGFLYPFVWLFAAIYGPVWGRAVAKESFAFFGYMGGVFLLGALFIGYLLARYPFQFGSQSPRRSI